MTGVHAVATKIRKTNLKRIIPLLGETRRIVPKFAMI
jgi:hypothetical protein